MAHVIRNSLIGCAVAGVLAMGAAAPSLAQVVVVDPPYYGYGPRVYVAPPVYGGYAYAPGYPSYGYYGRAPVEYDTSGMAFSTRDLGWQGGYPSGAPNNPCHIGQRMQNRC
jgi:hypothetical protein